MCEFVETCINYCEPGWAYVSSDERKWINRLRNLAKDKPEECVIMKQPEDNGGFIYGKVPQKWVRITPPRVHELTDEQKAKGAERLRIYREQRKAENGDSGELL